MSDLAQKSLFVDDMTMNIEYVLNNEINEAIWVYGLGLAMNRIQLTYDLAVFSKPIDISPVKHSHPEVPKLAPRGY